MSAALRALHATLRGAGLDDDDKRALYQRVTGKSSAKDMSDDERKAVRAELVRMYPHLKAASKPSQKRANRRLKLTGKYAGKLQALWIAGWNLGVFRNKDDAALKAFVKRQTGLDAVRFCHDPADATKAIEALKGWLHREADVKWSYGKLTPDFARFYGFKIAVAQWDILQAALPKEKRFRSNFYQFVYDNFGFVVRETLDEAAWHPVMNLLGRLIRDAKAAKAEAA
ncbi:MAG: regulatory protein GemA [Pseudomonadota bacterium]